MAKRRDKRITKKMLEDAVMMWRAGADSHKDGENFEVEMLSRHIFITGTIYNGNRSTMQVGWDKSGPYVWSGGSKFRFYQSERRDRGDLVREQDPSRY
jgi:hypothetical protein